MKWLSELPNNCQVCGKPFGKHFYDANTGMGWGLICDNCFKSHGCSLGIGKGQKYDTKTREKVGG